MDRTCRAVANCYINTMDLVCVIPNSVFSLVVTMCITPQDPLAYLTNVKGIVLLILCVLLQDIKSTGSGNQLAFVFILQIIKVQLQNLSLLCH